jgi:Kef-type K+ transport system membrane component KefB
LLLDLITLAQEAPQAAPVTHTLGVVAAILLSAKVLGELAERIGQPAVIGELLAGVLLGPSLLGLVDPATPVLHLLAEIGVIVLLFSIGLETRLDRLLAVGGTSSVVALAGVVLPFAGGYLVGELLGLSSIQSIVMGAALTATSVGITARVLADLGSLDRPEGQVIMGAAVIDDVIGLIILAVVSDLAAGASISALDVGVKTALAFGFLIAAVVLGALVARPLLARLERGTRLYGIAALALAIAFLFALAAEAAGSAPIIGAFAAGLVVAPTPQAHKVDRGVSALGSFFVPIFFVAVGAAVDVRTFLQPQALLLGSTLLAVAIIGKVAAGYAAWWFAGCKLLVGVGMMPRGEVGLIFAQMGITVGVLTAPLFSALAFVVFVTTFLAPPLLKRLLPPAEEAQQSPLVSDLVSDI